MLEFLNNPGSSEALSLRSRQSTSVVRRRRGACSQPPCHGPTLPMSPPPPRRPGLQL